MLSGHCLNIAEVFSTVEEGTIPLGDILSSISDDVQCCWECDKNVGDALSTVDMFSTAGDIPNTITLYNVCSVHRGMSSTSGCSLHQGIP